MSIEKLKKDAGLIEKCLKEKWYPIAKGKIDCEPECVLCEEYVDGRSSCLECPISQAVDAANCEETPYIKWAKSNEENKFAWEEVAFLENLLAEHYEQIAIKA